MNLENLSLLSIQLDKIGFKDMTASLAKRICLLPACFTISKSIARNNDELFFHFFFKADPVTAIYQLDYFDAGFQKQIRFDGLVVNGITLQELNREMKTIDWKAAFDFSDDAVATKESILSLSEAVEKIIRQFAQLKTSEEGQQLVALLKQKHWPIISTHEMAGSVTPIKTTAEITQRFYCADQQASVTVDDVYRFLQFKRIEKEMRAKTKKNTELSSDSTKANGKTSTRKPVTNKSSQNNK